VAITNYTELQAALTNWLNRTDLASRIPEFIALAEPDMRRRLRDSRSSSTLTMGAGTNLSAVPAAAKEIESIRYNESDKQYPLRKMTAAQLARVRSSGNGIPQAFAVYGSQIHWDRPSSDAFQTEVTYIEKITPLSVGSPTNTTLTNSPDIYLYGSLMQAAPFLEHDERVALWSAAYENALAAENAAREGADFGTGVEMDLPVAFGEDC